MKRGLRLINIPSTSCDVHEVRIQAPMKRGLRPSLQTPSVQQYRVRIQAPMKSVFSICQGGGDRRARRAERGGTLGGGGGIDLSRSGGRNPTGRQPGHDHHPGRCTGLAGSFERRGGKAGGRSGLRLRPEGQQSTLMTHHGLEGRRLTTDLPEHRVVGVSQAIVRR